MEILFVYEDFTVRYFKEHNRLTESRVLRMFGISQFTMIVNVECVTIHKIPKLGGLFVDLTASFIKRNKFQGMQRKTLTMRCICQLKFSCYFYIAKLVYSKTISRKIEMYEFIFYVSCGSILFFLRFFGDQNHYRNRKNPIFEIQDSKTLS